MAAPFPAVAAVSSSAPSPGLLPARRGVPLPSTRRAVAAPGGRMAATVARAVGDVGAEGNTFLIAGAVAVALVGTAFPIFFSRKDTCPECDGAGFVRKSGATLRANAARKDQAQIVCANCNGLGKLGQIDK
ncbi:hypothetical protein D1007_58427 [Hordeum vulgare]|uniref:Predicted protein n=1 Tax=Hordeum vulgare subsp. vulgare TaxID=112509 RepID=F2DMY4_HORVV|nr:uncharacterized protein LOC123404366 [Hordeum vulgare subsp. vulgare]KAE8769885.1 hypothetical protein D1007_58427 [Hordeum vulgare]BAJ96455.1 predicted protein [Hordeum vulgare subsp. vulgare]BAJ96995.1 predicted protein [Hordeum vulgare subsp. vulgare]BAJ99506.1 predicted protein [Hordeum vulgare subsp. vulgare]